MKYIIKVMILILIIIFFLTINPLFAQRNMENLGRGVVAIRKSSSEVFISWRILGLEFNSGVNYNLYRGSTQIASNLSVSNYMDNTSSNNTYSVSAVVNGTEQARSPAVNVSTYIHGSNTLACLKVPIQTISGYTPFLIYIGDLDGNGEYDFVFDLHPDDASANILLQAVKQDGSFLWQLDCGLNSVNKDNIEPGSSVLGIGHGDNFTVYDINNDGKAEVIIRTAKGVKFGDGAVLSENDNNRQFISVLEGTTGREIARASVAADFLSDGPMSGHMGIAYLDGVNPFVVWSSKNRLASGEFNMMVTTWKWDNRSLNQNWKFLRPGIGGGNYPDGHNIRCGDFDSDGRDEVSPFGFVLDDNGSVLYSLGDQGVVHGDRFHIGDLDPNRAGLEGYGIQQDNQSGLVWYCYDARTGNILHSQYADVGDYARSFAGDLDPRYSGYEFHTFTDGLYNVNGTRITTSLPDSYPNLRIWWDDDLLSENLDNKKMTKWDYIADVNNSEIRLYTFSNVIQAGRNTPGFYGDILGDWREEVVYTADDKSSLLVFTTVNPTNTRLYTLAHEPLYRNCLNVKGYYQSNMIGYYLGNRMASPQSPNIKYVNGIVSPTPAPDTFTKGDVNGDETINIIDALLVAQYYVGLDPTPFNYNAADTNCDGSVNIIDALLVAQYYVGLITSFC